MAEPAGATTPASPMPALLHQSPSLNRQSKEGADQCLRSPNHYFELFSKTAI
jgi:hypothetical protein